MVNLSTTVLGLDFWGTFGLTGAACAIAFCTGLRFGRRVYSKLLGVVEAPNSKNLMNDIGLSAGIGVSAGFFVGTDPALAGNIFRVRFWNSI